MAADPSDRAAGLDSLLVRMRPRLHRYCARMTGSVIDGEDVLQDALIKAVEAFASAGPIGAAVRSTTSAHTASTP